MDTERQAALERALASVERLKAYIQAHPEERLSSEVILHQAVNTTCPTSVLHGIADYIDGIVNSSSN